MNSNFIKKKTFCSIVRKWRVKLNDDNHLYTVYYKKCIYPFVFYMIVTNIIYIGSHDNNSPKKMVKVNNKNNSNISYSWTITIYQPFDLTHRALLNEIKLGILFSKTKKFDKNKKFWNSIFFTYILLKNSWNY